MAETLRHSQGVFAPDRNEGVDPAPRQVGAHTLRPVLDLERVGARGPQDGPAQGQDVAAPDHVERHRDVVEDALPPVEVPHDLVAVAELGGQDHRPDHGVEAGAVTPAGEDPDAHPIGAEAVRAV